MAGRGSWVGVGSPVSQLRAGPSERELERLEEEISEQLGGAVEPAPAEPMPPARANVPAEAALIEIIAPSEAAPEPSPSAPPPPWYARHARKLIAATGAAVLAVTYSAWKVPTEAPRRIQPQPAIPEAAVPATAAPATPPATAAPATPAPAAPPPVQSPPPRTASRASPPPPPAVAAPSGPRPPSVTHTQREPAPASTAPAAAGPAAAAPATAAPVPAPAAPPAATPSDCPDAVAALGLCASQARKGGK